MKCCKVPGAKSYKEGKCIAEEMLPNRMAKATITGGDLYQRMGNYYKKTPNDGAQTGASPLITFTTVGRGFGMA